MRHLLVVPAFNRYVSTVFVVRRLLSLRLYDQFDLVVSCDSEEIYHQLALLFDDEPIVIKKNDQPMGLRRHILEILKSGLEYETVTVLEDDIFVADGFSIYFQESVTKLKNCVKTIAFSHYSPDFNEFTGFPFYPKKVGYDNYFMQIPSSWGQTFFTNKLVKFLTQADGDFYTDFDNRNLPKACENWNHNSWKILLYKYLISEEMWFSYPYESYSTNLNSPGGTNLVTQQNAFSVNLTANTSNVSISSYSSESIRYDAHMESCLLSEELSELYSELVIVDCYGAKDISIFHQDQLILTSKKCRDAIVTFSFRFFPIESNIEFQYPYETDATLKIARAKNISKKLPNLYSVFKKLSYYNMRFVSFYIRESFTKLISKIIKI